jgi:hypothetical protein
MKRTLRVVAAAAATTLAVAGLSACTAPSGGGSVPAGCFPRDSGGDDLLVESDRDFTEFSSTNGSCTGTPELSGYMFYWSLKPVTSDDVLQKMAEVCEPRGYSHMWPVGLDYNNAHPAFENVWGCF